MCNRGHDVSSDQVNMASVMTLVEQFMADVPDTYFSRSRAEELLLSDAFHSYVKAAHEDIYDNIDHSINYIQNIDDF